jgi:hypothetical protein
VHSILTRVVVYGRGTDGREEQFDPKTLSLPEWMRLVYVVVELLCRRRQYNDAVAILRRLQVSSTVAKALFVALA